MPTLVLIIHTWPESPTLSSKLTFFTAETATHPLRFGSQSTAAITCDTTSQMIGTFYVSPFTAYKAQLRFLWVKMRRSVLTDSPEDKLQLYGAFTAVQELLRNRHQYEWNIYFTNDARGALGNCVKEGDEG